METTGVETTKETGTETFKETLPVLKWAGGKRRLAPKIADLLFRGETSRENSIYYEPFFGGGAAFFHLVSTGKIHPSRCILGDVNEEIANFYRVLRDDWSQFAFEMKTGFSAYLYVNTETAFYAMRSRPERRGLSKIERACRLLYLNKTCFNGIYRTNKRGQFNVPFGKYKNPTICDERALERAAEALKNTVFHRSDFESAVCSAQEGDLVYFDPPYDPIGGTSNFTSYDERGFGEKEQRRLAKIFHALKHRDVRVVLSNHDTPLVRELYGKDEILVVEVPRAINSKGDRRGTVSEVLVT